MPSFADTNQLEAYMRVDLTADSVSAQSALDTATAFIQGWTGQTIELVEDDVVEVVPKVNGTVLLPQLPVISVASVVSDGEAVEFVLRPAGIVLLRSSWEDTVTVTYSHGYATIPPAVVSATVQEAARIYKASDAAAEGVRAETESIDDYTRTVQYMEGGTESAGAGSMLAGSQHLLAPYRHRSLV